MATLMLAAKERQSKERKHEIDADYITRRELTSGALHDTLSVAKRDKKYYLHKKPIIKRKDDSSGIQMARESASSYAYELDSLFADNFNSLTEEKRMGL